MEQGVQQESVKVTLLRNGIEEKIKVKTVSYNYQGTNRFALWGGGVVHNAHPSISIKSGIEKECVYISSFFYGSPVNRSGLMAANCITEIDGRPVKNLDDFIGAVSGKDSGEIVKVRTTDVFDKSTRVNAVRTDSFYWPLVNFIYEDKQWQRAEL